MPPLVSVIMPVHNKSRYLREALDSALNQTLAGREIIAVDDGSRDDSVRILREYGDRIRLVTQDNLGVSAARNRGLDLAQGELVGFLDADDLWLPEALSVMSRHLQENPDVDLAAGAAEEIDEDGVCIRRPKKPAAYGSKLRQDFLKTLALVNPFPIHSLLVRRRCFACCGGFDPALPVQEDWDLWLRLVAHGHAIGTLDAVVARYRRLSAGLTGNLARMEDFGQRVLNKPVIAQALLRYSDLDRHARIAALLRNAMSYLRAGQPHEAQRRLQSADELMGGASWNETAALLYLEVAALLPGAETNARRVGAALPMDLAYYYRRRMVQASGKREYAAYLKALASMVLLCPRGCLMLARLKIRGLFGGSERGKSRSSRKLAGPDNGAL